MGQPFLNFSVPLFSPFSPYPIPMVESHNNLALYNVAGWQDPTIFSDMNFTARKADAEIVNNLMWLNYMQGF